MNPWYKDYLTISLHQNRKANVEVLDLTRVAGSTTPWFWPGWLVKNQGFLDWHELTDPVTREVYFSNPSREDHFNPDRYRGTIHAHPSKDPA